MPFTGPRIKWKKKVVKKGAGFLGGFLLKNTLFFAANYLMCKLGESKYGGNRYLLHVKGFLYRK